jgi:hypothetical protein
MKGADQCPKCASRRWVDVDEPSPKGFYARIVRVCANCKTLWEPFAVEDLKNPTERLSVFKSPCNNCAFRKGSPEQQDEEEWAKTMASLQGGAMFFCHKGTAIEPGSEHGFAYPGGGTDTKTLIRKGRLCRGYLNSIVGPRMRAAYGDEGE